MTKPKVLGLDISMNSTGLAYGKSSGVIAPPKLRGAARLLYHREEFRKMLAHRTVTHAVIEGYAYAARGALMAQIGEVTGVYKVELAALDIPFLVVGPKQVKKFATGDGNADKPKVAASVSDMCGREFRTDDECDAFVLMCIGFEMLGRSHPLAAAGLRHGSALDSLSAGDWQ